MILDRSTSIKSQLKFAVGINGIKQIFLYDYTSFLLIRGQKAKPLFPSFAVFRKLRRSGGGYPRDIQWIMSKYMATLLTDASMINADIFTSK